MILGIGAVGTGLYGMNVPLPEPGMNAFASICVGLFGLSTIYWGLGSLAYRRILENWTAKPYVPRSILEDESEDIHFVTLERIQDTVLSHMLDTSTASIDYRAFEKIVRGVTDIESSQIRRYFQFLDLNQDQKLHFREILSCLNMNRELKSLVSTHFVRRGL